MTNNYLFYLRITGCDSENSQIGLMNNEKTTTITTTDMKYFHKDSYKNLKGVEKKKYHIRERIIRYLFLHKFGTCTQVAKTLHLSAPSVQLYINDLVSDRVVRETGQGVTSAGRPPVVYGLDPNAFSILCIDISDFRLGFANLQSDFRVAGEVIYYDIDLRGDSQYLEKLYHYTREFLETSMAESSGVIGIGISMPGLIDSEKGVNYSYLYDENEGLAGKLQKRFDLPVYIENDSNVIALAEYWHGGAQGKKNAIVLNLNWGIGAGFILNGSLYHGSSGFAGEFGHIPSKENGKLCWCNKQGCLETVASTKALSDMAKEGIKNGELSMLSRYVKGEDQDIHPDLIINAAGNGDQFAVKILANVGFELGRQIATIVQLLNPEVIILTGVMAKAGQYLTTSIQQAMNSYCNPTMVKNMVVKPTELGENSVFLGTAVMLMEKVSELNLQISE